MIESIAGAKKYRQSPSNPRMVQVQPSYGRTWVDYAPRDTPQEARALVLALAMRKDETQEMEAVQD